MRRHEFEVTERETAHEILRSARIGHLCFVRDGWPEVLPYNFVLTDHGLEFHCSPKTGLAQASGHEASFLAYDSVAWIPSTWRHPELACPATTYYRGVTVKARLEEVTSLEEKAKSLACFMRKYQPDEPYKPLHHSDYHKPLRALFVVRLKLEEVSCKVKMGQHLTANHRARVFDRLGQRNAPGDAQVRRVMRAVNPDLVTREPLPATPRRREEDRPHAS